MATCLGSVNHLHVPNELQRVGSATSAYVLTLSFIIGELRRTKFTAAKRQLTLVATSKMRSAASSC